MALNANALITLAVAKSYLDIPALDTTFDPLIEMLINSASQLIETYCQRSFKSQSYTKFFDGQKQADILLPQYPVTAISSLNVDADHVFGPDTLIPSTDYGLVGDSVRLHTGVFSAGSQNVKVVFTAGFSTIPADLQLGCMMFVDWLYRHRGDRRVGRTSIGKGGETTAYTQTIPEEVKAFLQPHVRVEFPGSREVRST